MYSLSLLWICG